MIGRPTTKARAKRLDHVPTVSQAYKGNGKADTPRRQSQARRHIEKRNWDGDGSRRNTVGEVRQRATKTSALTGQNTSPSIMRNTSAPYLLALNVKGMNTSQGKPLVADGLHLVGVVFYLDRRINR